ARGLADEHVPQSHSRLVIDQDRVIRVVGIELLFRRHSFDYGIERIVDLEAAPLVALEENAPQPVEATRLLVAEFAGADDDGRSTRGAADAHGVERRLLQLGKIEDLAVPSVGGARIDTV